MNDLVARAKFQREAERIQTYIATERRGYRWRLLKVDSARIILEMEHPGHEPLILRVWAHDWDQRAASYRFIDRADPTFTRILPPSKWPGWPFHDNHTGPFRDDHRPIGDAVAQKAAGRRPFICLHGTREFHEDQRHQNEPWEQFRGMDNYSILATLISIQAKIHDVTPLAKEAPHG